MKRIFVLILCLSSVAHAGDQSRQDIRASLERARLAQQDVLANLHQLSENRQEASSLSDLLRVLRTLHDMQLGVVRGGRALLARTFGQSADALEADDRQAVERLGADQQSVHRRFEEWRAQMHAAASLDGAAESVRIVNGRAEASAAGSLMEEAKQQIDEMTLSEASTTAQRAADEIAKLIHSLEVGMLDAAALLDQRLRELSDILVREKAVRAKLEPDREVDWRRLGREQADVRERTRLLTFEETGLATLALEAVRTAHDFMRNAETGLRQRNHEEAVLDVDKAIAELQKAIAAAEAAEGEVEENFMPERPEVKDKRPEKMGGMPAMMGEQSGGIDVSPIAQIAADMALVAKLKRRQQALYSETIGKASAKPLPAGRQTSYAAQLPQLIQRVTIYLPDVAEALDTARGAMVESAEALRQNDNPASAARQEVALERLDYAEQELRTFWEELFKAMSRISSLGGSAPPHGAGQKEEEKAKMNLLLILMREIVRIGALMKDLDVIMAKTTVWMDSPAASIDEKELGTGVAEQWALRDTALDIFEQLKPAASEAQALPEAVMEAAQWLEGAHDAMKESDFARAHERQTAALDFLENAWTIMAMSMATISQNQQQQSPSDPQNKTGEAQFQTGEAAAAGSETEGDTKPWYWDLPPAAREAIVQSMNEEFPPRYAPAIKRYYERLSRNNADTR